MKTVRMDFGIEKLGLIFSSGGIPVVLDLTDLKRDPTLPGLHQTGWLGISSVWRCHLSWELALIFCVRLVEERCGLYKSSFLGPSGIQLLPATAGQRLTGPVLAGSM